MSIGWEVGKISLESGARKVEVGRGVECFDYVKGGCYGRRMEA